MLAKVILTMRVLTMMMLMMMVMMVMRIMRMLIFVLFIPILMGYNADSVKLFAFWMQAPQQR